MRPAGSDQPPRGRRALRGFTDLTPVHSGELWTIYRAVDVEFQMPVSLRVSRAATVPTYLVEELAAEMEILARMEPHPNIVRVLRFERWRNGSGVVVTELCRQSVAERLAQSGPFPAPEAFTVGRAVAAAVAAAHSHGLVHGEVRPQCILVTRAGNPALGGFGMAALRRATRTSGTPVDPHVAPETFKGEQVGPPADVYGLGSTIYELVSGRPPFRAFAGETPASFILRKIGDTPPRLSEPGIPVVMVDLIDACLSQDPASRPSTTDMAAALASVEFTQPVEHSTPPPVDAEAATPSPAGIGAARPAVTGPIAGSRNVVEPIAERPRTIGG